jgi:ATP-dependent Lon protease
LPNFFTSNENLKAIPPNTRNIDRKYGVNLMATNNTGDGIQFKEQLPLLPIRDLVVYPFMIVPLFVGRESSIAAVEDAVANNDKLILLVSQKEITAENPAPSEIYSVGTVCMIMRMRKLPDGRVKVLIQGLAKARISSYEAVTPFYKVKVSKIEDIAVDETGLLVKLRMNQVKDQLEKVVAQGKTLSPDLVSICKDLTNPGRISDLIASNLTLPVDKKQGILEAIDPIERLNKISEVLLNELDAQPQTFEEMYKSQKAQLRRPDFSEYGNEQYEDEFSEFRSKIFRSKLPAEAEKEALKQLSRIEKMHPESSEATIIKNYLDWIVDLPWSVASDDSIDLKVAKEILDTDHYELESVKERILEFLAVKRLKGSKMKGPILCFAGPPGVGKTSLGKSIAKATARKFARISLGGVKDEAEIRGHRRTYVGAMPGRIIQALKQIKTNNPVLLLDEVDKLGGDFRGDPASALLEVLDSEQNDTFRDNFLNLPFDLSNILFIATANVVENIPAPLRDRMEIIQLSGYTEEEKIKICQKFLIPKQIEENGIPVDMITYTEDSIRSIIRNFTFEAGLRTLERKIGSVCRKIAIRVANNDLIKTLITAELVEKYLGPGLYSDEEKNENHEVGVGTGLAWTSAGGQIFRVETTKMKGKGITLTGQLGDVMKESAQTALGFIKSRADQFCIDENIFENCEIHIHLPAGAIPKDGPSAGIILATTIVSLFTNCPVNKDLAMTGEITLTGKVLPIGGLKEKALAAMRAGITTLIIPWKNQKDLADIPKEYLEKIKFIPVKQFEEVLEIALINWKQKKKTWKQPTPGVRDNIAA